MDFLKTLVGTYFSQLASISEKYAPPGTNAANGHWRDETFDDQALKSLESEPNIEISGSYKEFHNIFVKFQGGIREAFSNENYQKSWIEDLPLFWDVFKKHTKDLLDVFIDIVGLFGNDKDKQQAAKEKLFDDLEKLVKKVSDDGIVPQGRHANGHISVGVNKAAREANDDISQAFPTGAETEPGKLAVALRAVCSKLLTLKTDGHDPWLRAEWQISYQAVTRGAAEALGAQR